jgi:hypothetical protein
MLKIPWYEPLFRSQLRIASNIKSLPATADDGTILENRYIDLGGGSALSPLCTLWECLRHDVVIINNAQRPLFALCLLHYLLPFSRANLVVVDLLLSKPRGGLPNRLKNLTKRLLLKKVDLLILYQKDTEGIQKYYGIPARKFRYIPFKVNSYEEVLAMQPPEGEYVFSGGQSHRDYATLCEAVMGLDYPTVILTPKPQASAEHGTFFDGQSAPANVRVVHDDGSPGSWIEYLANARLVVLPVTPNALTPASVGTYIIAMALGKCVIITDSPATRGILEHEGNAIIVPMQDPAALREAIRRAWEDDDYRRRIARKGYEYAMSLGGEQTLYANIARTTVSFLRGIASGTQG